MSYGNTLVPKFQKCQRIWPFWKYRKLCYERLPNWVLTFWHTKIIIMHENIFLNTLLLASVHSCIPMFYRSVDLHANISSPSNCAKNGHYRRIFKNHHEVRVVFNPAREGEKTPNKMHLSRQYWMMTGRGTVTVRFLVLPSNLQKSHHLLPCLNLVMTRL